MIGRQAQLCTASTFVWCPKYRRKVLIGTVAGFVESQIRQIADAQNYTIIEMYVMPDHVRLFVRRDPFESPVDIAERFKAVAAVRTFKRFPELRKKLWDGVLRSPSYYVCTAGPAETIALYIRGQESDSSI